MTSNRTLSAEPTANSLREAALAYLARHATTKVALQRFLDRRIGGWEARAVNATPDDGEEIRARGAKWREAAAVLVEALVAAGAVDDTTFAEMRGARLARTGRSRNAVLAHLVRKGVDTGIARGAVPRNEETELNAALLAAQRRRFGPFRRQTDNAAGEIVPVREKAALARAGFARTTVDRALAMPIEDALSFMRRVRQRQGF